MGLAKGHTSPPLVGPPRKWSPQNEQDTSEAERKIDIDTSPLSSSKPPRAKRSQSPGQFVKSNGRSPSPQGSTLSHYGESMPESPDPKKAKVAWGGQGRVTESSRNETIDTETISNGHMDSEIHDIGGSVTSSPLNISSVSSFREHDEETLSVLNISFPPSTTPTFGLSRAVSPPESELERYSSLVEKAIMSNMVAPLSKEWKKKTHDFLPKPLKQHFKETLDELDKVLIALFATDVLINLHYNIIQHNLGHFWSFDLIALHAHWITVFAKIMREMPVLVHIFLYNFCCFVTSPSPSLPVPLGIFNKSRSGGYEYFLELETVSHLYYCRYF